MALAETWRAARLLEVAGCLCQAHWVLGRRSCPERGRSGRPGPALVPVWRQMRDASQKLCPGGLGAGEAPEAGGLWGLCWWAAWALGAFFPSAPPLLLRFPGPSIAATVFRGVGGCCGWYILHAAARWAGVPSSRLSLCGGLRLQPAELNTSSGWGVDEEVRLGL